MYKQYVIQNELSRKNITNLLLITKNKNLRKLPEVVFPLEIVKKSNVVLGYTMPYIKGKTLEEYLLDKSILHNKKLEVLIMLARVINAMPRGVYIGDLHSNNILIDEKESIHIIDVDGFSLKKGYQISCPAEHWLTDVTWSQNRKYWRKGKFRISQNTDILCWYMFFVRWLMGVSPLMYTDEEVRRYFSFLKSTDFPTAILADVFRLASRQQNIIDISHISELRNKDTTLYSYHEYRKYCLLNNF